MMISCLNKACNRLVHTGAVPICVELAIFCGDRRLT
jgi:hypothetical protein